MAAAPVYIPVEEYLRTSYSPDAEYVDGQIVERAAGENEHSDWQKALVIWFESQARKAGIRVRPEFRVQVDAACFLVPDLALLDRNRPVERYATHPPLAVIEILSPEDSFRRVLAKCCRYARMGVLTILVLDPDGEKYRYVEGRLEPLTARAFDLPGCGARFDLDEIEKLLD
jgi:Uma2 family endonuclease